MANKPGKSKHCPRGGMLCDKCSAEPSYMEFRLCKNKCFACNECGYFWGQGFPDEDQRGKRPYWVTK